MPVLIVQHEGTRRAAALPARLLIGRRSMNQLVIDHRAVSRMHAWIDGDHGQFTITDCASRTGTRVNGDRITPGQPLHDGDDIEIGPAHLTFLATDELPQGVEPFNLPDHPAIAPDEKGHLFDCPACRAPLWAPLHYVGQTVQCSYCTEPLTIPEPASAAPAHHAPQAGATDDDAPPTSAEGYALDEHTHEDPSHYEDQIESRGAVPLDQDAFRELVGQEFALHAGAHPDVAPIDVTDELGEPKLGEAEPERTDAVPELEREAALEPELAADPEQYGEAEPEPEPEPQREPAVSERSAPEIPVVEELMPQPPDVAVDVCAPAPVSVKVPAADSATPAPARRNRAGEETCGVCQSAISVFEDKTTCPQCGLTFHAECWAENYGCSAYGCSMVNALAPADEQPAAEASSSDDGNADGATAGATLDESPEDAAHARRVPWEFVLLAGSVFSALLGAISFGVPSLAVAGGSLFYMTRDRERRGNGVLILSTALALLGVVTGATVSYLIYFGGRHLGLG